MSSSRSRSHEWHVRLIVSGTPGTAVYRVIAETGRAALNKATRHVRATETHFVAAVQRTAKGVNPADYKRDCELYLLTGRGADGREDTREPFRADLAGAPDPGRERVQGAE